MAEQLRRLDYERRSKYKSLMKPTSGTGIQNIKKECSTQVRAANEMEERKKQLYLLKNQLHKRTFIERHDYEVKVMERFKNDLDVKSQNFNDDKFQLLRARSAGPRLPEAKPVVLAMVPKKYYESPSGDDSDDDNMATWTRGKKRSGIQKQVTQKQTAGTDTNMLLNFCTLRAVLKFKSRKRPNEQRSIKRSTSFTDSKQERLAESLRFLHPDEFRRFKEDTDETSNHPGSSSNRTHAAVSSPVDRVYSAMQRRRQSSATSTLTAYIPRDVKSAPPGGHTNHRQANEHGATDDNGSRSYRLLKSAFRKKRKEIPNPAKDRFKKIQSDHEKHVVLLNERIKKRFNDIFEETIFEPCYTKTWFTTSA